MAIKLDICIHIYEESTVVIHREKSLFSTFENQYIYISCITIYQCKFTTECNVDCFLDENLQLYNRSNENI